MNHTFHLHADEFLQIYSGAKTIESRLYDEKRQKIHVGDTVTFVSRADYKTNLVAIVLALHRYYTFDELFDSVSLSKFGNLSKEQLVEQVRQFYIPSDEQRYGVVGIEFVIKKHLANG